MKSTTVLYTRKECAIYGIDSEVRFTEKDGKMIATVNNKTYIIPGMASDEFIKSMGAEIKKCISTGYGGTIMSAKFTEFIFKQLKTLI